MRMRFITILIIVTHALYAVSVFAAEDNSHLSKDKRINEARKLIDADNPYEALKILRPLNIAARKDIIDIRFLIGLASMRAAEYVAYKEDKEALLDESIAAFRAILLAHPELTRVRLELALAFFIKKEDGLAKDHFERVLSSDPPPPMANNIRRFLYVINKRKRWSGYFVTNIQHSNNINNGPNSRIVAFGNIRGLELPESDLPREEYGLVFSGGGAYEYPLNERWKWLIGADATHAEYKKSDIDQTYLSINTGPRWIGKNTDASFRLSGGQRIISGTRRDKDIGLSVNGHHRLSEKWNINGGASWTSTRYRKSQSTNKYTNSAGYSLGATYYPFPILQTGAGVSFSDSRPYNNNQDSRAISGSLNAGVILPYGWTISGRAEWSRTNHQIFSTSSAQKRVDRRRVFRLFALNRKLTWQGFSPQIIFTRTLQASNQDRSNFERGEFGLRWVKQF